MGMRAHMNIYPVFLLVCTFEIGLGGSDAWLILRLASARSYLVSGSWICTDINGVSGFRLWVDENSIDGLIVLMDDDNIIALSTGVDRNELTRLVYLLIHSDP